MNKPKNCVVLLNRSFIKKTVLYRGEATAGVMTEAMAGVTVGVMAKVTGRTKIERENQQ